VWYNDVGILLAESRVGGAGGGGEDNERAFERRGKLVGIENSLRTIGGCYSTKLLEKGQSGGPIDSGSHKEGRRGKAKMKMKMSRSRMRIVGGSGRSRGQKQA
jgi:hypothetical protein